MPFHVLCPGYRRRPFLFLLKLPGPKCRAEALSGTSWAGLWVQPSRGARGPVGGRQGLPHTVWVWVWVCACARCLHRWSCKSFFPPEFIVFGAGIPSLFRVTVDTCNPCQFIRLSPGRQPLRMTGPSQLRALSLRPPRLSTAVPTFLQVPGGLSSFRPRLASDAPQARASPPPGSLVRRRRQAPWNWA